MISPQAAVQNCSRLRCRARRHYDDTLSARTGFGVFLLISILLILPNMAIIIKAANTTVGAAAAAARTRVTSTTCQKGLDSPGGDINGMPVEMPTSDPAPCAKLCRETRFCAGWVLRPRSPPRPGAPPCLPPNTGTTNKPRDWPASQCFLKYKMADKLVNDSCSCTGTVPMACPVPISTTRPFAEHTNALTSVTNGTADRELLGEAEKNKGVEEMSLEADDATAAAATKVAAAAATSTTTISRIPFNPPCPDANDAPGVISGAERRGQPLGGGAPLSVSSWHHCALACSANADCVAWTVTLCTPFSRTYGPSSGREHAYTYTTTSATADAATAADKLKCTLHNLLLPAEPEPHSCTGTVQHTAPSTEAMAVVPSDDFTPWGYVQNPYHRLRHRSGHLRVHDRLNGLAFYPDGVSAPNNLHAQALIVPARTRPSVPTAGDEMLLTADDFTRASVPRWQFGQNGVTNWNILNE
eukprot:UC1_evm3s765